MKRHSCTAVLEKEMVKAVLRIKMGRDLRSGVLQLVGEETSQLLLSAGILED